MKTQLLIAGLFVFFAFSAAAQVTGEFYMEKETFAPGEPVFLYFKLSNRGPGAIRLMSPDIDQPFCSGNSITVTSDPPPAHTCMDLAHSGCTINGSLKPLPPLLPGQSNIEPILLNFNNEINVPGNYLVEAKHIAMPTGAGGETQASLSFRVDADAPPYLATKLQPWVEQLKSTDPMKRFEAAQTLASLAPRSLEDTLIGFAADPEFRRYTPLALHRLNTPRSIEAMANMVKASGIGTWEQMEGARYLAETGDQQWYPLLLDLALKNGKISNYPAYAAELGGESMLPDLLALANNPDTRLQAVMALGSTASRQAIPILIYLLKTRDQGVSWRAAYSLRLLTHRIAGQNGEAHDPQTDYRMWTKWWQSEGATAPIYKDTECGEMVPLQ